MLFRKMEIFIYSMSMEISFFVEIGKKGFHIYIPVSISDIHRVLELGSGISGIFWLSSLSDTSKQTFLPKPPESNDNGCNSKYRL